MLGDLFGCRRRRHRHLANIFYTNSRNSSRFDAIAGDADAVVGDVIVDTKINHLASGAARIKQFERFNVCCKDNALSDSSPFDRPCKYSLH